MPTQLPDLNFPSFAFSLRVVKGQTEIFDRVRKKFVRLTPEEWVRQHMIHYLVLEKKVPESLIAVEKKLILHQVWKRTDIVVFNNTGHPVLLVECKSPAVPLNTQVFDQIARYNLSLRVRYLVVTNGLEHYCCQMDPANSSYRFLEEIPSYGMIV
jgi:hypothetical protein